MPWAIRRRRPRLRTPERRLSRAEARRGLRSASGPLHDRIVSIVRPAGVLLLCHWLACVWMLVGRLEMEHGRPNWVEYNLLLRAGRDGEIWVDAPTSWFLVRRPPPPAPPPAGPWAWSTWSTLTGPSICMR